MFDTYHPPRPNQAMQPPACSSEAASRLMKTHLFQSISLPQAVTDLDLVRYTQR